MLLGVFTEVCSQVLRAVARSLAVLHNKYAVDLHRAVSIIIIFCPRPELRIGEEEATAARTWNWRPRKISSCARRRRRWRFSGQQLLYQPWFASHHNFVLLGMFLCAAVQPVYPRAPGHRPVTNLRKALEKWYAVCYLARGLVGLFTWPRENNNAVVVLFWGGWELTFVQLRSAGNANRTVF